MVKLPGDNFTNQFVRCQHKVNGAKDALLFHQHFCYNFTAYFSLQHFCQASYFDTFLPYAIALEIIENYLRKSCSALVPNMLVKLTPLVA
jgi:hypothetical protein